MFLPFLLAGLLASATGAGLIFTNEKRTVDYQQAFDASPSEFIASKKMRTEGFIKWCPYTLYGMSALITVGIALFLFLPTANGRATGLAIYYWAFRYYFSTTFLKSVHTDTMHKLLPSLNKPS
ncbi:MAG: hypothetical protein DRQ64_02530 [Gammaproteobacteria bacterium]|nr:MAG: hypothetical protein DRQ64_02530 [Gammaproteobacteria bacterium]